MMTIRLQRLYAALVATLLLPAAATADSGWDERLDFGGDFRLRFESIRADGSADRDRGRLRGRFGLTAIPSDDLQVVLRFATGDGSPVSTNLTLDGGFSAKDINLDRAYVAWRINEAWKLQGGKMKLPWFRAGGSSLIWDSDLNPEGAAALYSSKSAFASLGVFVVEERSDADDSLLLTGQAGLTFALAGDNRLAAGLGYYAYSNTMGNTPYYDGSGRGNTVDIEGNYVNDYRLVEMFVEYRSSLGELPATFFANAVNNTAVSRDDGGLEAGVTLGRAARPGSAQVSYAWQDTGADAVVATFNDSDFAGGNSAARGHFIKAKYALRDNVSLGGTLIVAERDNATGFGQDYNRVMLDIEFSFD